MLVARTDCQSTFPSRQTHETATPDTTTPQRTRVRSEKPVSLKSTFDLNKSVSVSSADAPVRIARVSRDEVMDRLEQLGWEPAGNVAHTLIEKKSILHELDSWASLSQQNKTELGDVWKSLSIPLSGCETKPQLTRKTRRYKQSENHYDKQARNSGVIEGRSRCVPTTSSTTSGWC